jgi:CheY-like chemotaxis protein
MPSRSLAARDDVPPPIIGPEHGRPNGVAAWHAERSATAAPETPHGTPLHALVVGGDGSKLLPLLEALNVTATVVAKAHHAFAMLDSFAFDVVAIEVDLGERSDLDGLRVCQAIRGQQRPPGEVCPPILVTSARPSPLEEARASLAGARGYLGGPLLERDLERALIEAGVRVTPVTSSPISLRA